MSSKPIALTLTYLIILSAAVVMTTAVSIPTAIASTNVITNGSFVSDTSNWSFVVVAGSPTGSWDSSGYANGGSAKISSEVGRNKSGEGYWEQTITTTIEAGSIVTLSYAWKKGYAAKAPGRQDIYITIVKPDATTADIDSQLGEPSAYDTWYTVSDKDVSFAFNQTGTYKIRLRYDYKTGKNASAQALAWFDEVELLVAPPPPPAPPGDLIANGSFENNTDNWSFAVVAGAPTGSWDPSGYAIGGSVKISSEVGRRKDGEGYWGQAILGTIEAGSTMKLSYAWKKGYTAKAPVQQDIYVTIVKPDATTVDIDSQLGVPGAYDTWYTVSDKDVSASFDQTGTYTIRLRYDYKTGSNSSAQAFAWFDEVKLVLSPPTAGDNWTDKAETPEVGGYGEGVVGTGSYIYVAKCLYASSTPRFWRYDPTANSWTNMSISGLPTGAFRNGTALAWDNSDYIYVLGGARYSDADRRLFFRYSISGDSWTQMADTPGPQGAGDAITWSGYDDYIYAILGSSGHGTVFARYNATSNSWETRTSPPAGTDDGASLVWTGGAYLYALRGEYLETTPLRDFWRYDIVNDSWATMENIPEEGGVGDGGSMIWVGNWLPEQSDYIYALGGGSAWEDADDNFYRYSISTDSWTQLADIPYPITDYNAPRLGFANDHIYYWQGTPSDYPGGGKKFAMYEFPI